MISSIPEVICELYANIVTFYIRDLSILGSWYVEGTRDDPGTNPLLDRDKGKHATVHIYNDKEKYSKLYLSEKSNFQQQP